MATIHEYYQIDACPGVRLSHWYRIYSINKSRINDYQYIRFVSAWDLSGNPIYLEIKSGSDVIVGVQYVS